MASGLRIHNLKVSVVFNKAIDIPSDWKKKPNKKYFIYGQKPEHIFTFYPLGNKINVTNVKNIIDIGRAVDELLTIISWKKTNSYKVNIDNITASYRARTTTHQSPLNLEHFCNYIKGRLYVTRVRYYAELFPCCFINTQFGLVILSRKYNYSLVGANTILKINALHKLIQTHLSIFKNQNPTSDL